MNLSENGNLENITIQDSEFINISHTAIRLIGKRNNQFKNINILNNKVFKTGGPGMVFNSTTNLLAKNNDINYTGSMMIQESGEEEVVYGHGEVPML